MKNKKQLLIISSIVGVILITGVPFILTATIDDPDTIDLGREIFISEADINKLKSQRLSQEEKSISPKKSPAIQKQIEKLLKEKSISQRIFGDDGESTDSDNAEVENNFAEVFPNQDLPNDFTPFGISDQQFSNNPDIIEDPRAPRKHRSVPTWGSNNVQSLDDNKNSAPTTYMPSETAYLQNSPFPPQKAKGNIVNTTREPEKPIRYGLPESENEQFNPLTDNPNNFNNNTSDHPLNNSQKDNKSISRYNNYPPANPYPRSMEAKENKFTTDTFGIASNDYAPINTFDPISQQGSSPHGRTDRIADKGIAFISHPLIDSYINKYSKQDRETFARSIERMELYYPIARKLANQYGLPTDIALLPLALSAYNPQLVDSKQRAGLWQLKPYLAQAYNLKMDNTIDERMDIEKSTSTALQQMKTAQRIFNNWDLTIASMVAGSGYVIDKSEELRTKNISVLMQNRKFREKTNDIIPRFHALMALIKAPNKYGIRPVNLTGKLDYEKVAAPAGISMSQLATKLNMNQIELKYLNPQLIRNKVPENMKNFKLKVPQSKARLAYSLVGDNRRSIPLYDPLVAMEGGLNADTKNDPWENEQEAYALSKSWAKTRNENPSIAALPTEGLTEIFGSTIEPAYNVGVKKYIVQKGDTLSEIAEKFSVDIYKIVSANHIPNLNALNTGTILRIPVDKYSSGINPELPADVISMNEEPSYNRKSHVYKIQKGDSLIRIARQHNINLNDLYDANMGLTDQIVPGQKITIPITRISRANN